MKHSCPVCGYDDLDGPPTAYIICQCCGTEFGYHDAERTHEELRCEWIARGASSHSRRRPPPNGWSAIDQLRAARLRLPETSAEKVSAS